MSAKISAKQEREHRVLLGLVEEYITTGKPVGSNTLKEAGFEDLSSATIRNYFANLEKSGFLEQLHASGGRIPTEKAWRVYVDEFLDQTKADPSATEDLKNLRSNDTQEIVTFLQHTAERLSQRTRSAVFLQAPRFDHDFILNLKLVPIDTERTLCVILTDFGVVKTEMLFSEHRLSTLAVRRIEDYFHWRLTGQDKPEQLESEEEKIAKRWYNEIVMRYIVGYANFSHADVFRTGISNLLNYPEFDNTTPLANCLSLFENTKSLHLIATESMKYNRLKIWVGSELKTYSTAADESTVLSIPYHVNHKPVGAIGLLGPMRISYKQWIADLMAFSEAIGDALTKVIYKYKISFRQPAESYSRLAEQEIQLIEHSKSMLLEDKSK